MKIFLLSLSVLLCSGCAQDQPEPAPAAGELDTEVVRQAVTGFWDIEGVLVVFFEEDGTPATHPATVYPDHDSEVFFVDGPSSMVRFKGTMDLRRGGIFVNKRRIWVDGQLIEDSHDVGTWVAEAGAIVLDIPEILHVQAFVDVVNDDRVQLEWNRQDPNFVDTSCPFIVYLARPDTTQ